MNEPGIVTDVEVEPSATGYWNYRIVVTLRRDGETELDICEVYYDADDTPRSYVRRAPGGATRGEIFEAHARMALAFEKPTLQWVGGEAREIPAGQG